MGAHTPPFIFNMKKQKETKEIEELKDKSRALIEMYQAGFLDGYNSKSFKKHLLSPKIKKLCINSFNKRFQIKSTKEGKNGNIAIEYTDTISS